MLLTEILRKALKLYPHKKAIICQDRVLTYRQFGDRVFRFSNTLSQRGVKKGDRVAILHRNCHHYLETYFAVMAIGAVLVPINYRLSPGEVAFILEDSGARVLIAEEDFRSKVDSVKGKIPDMPELIWTGPVRAGDDRGGESYEAILTRSSADEPSESGLSEGDLAQLYYTSGTTGRPKGVMLTHKNVYAHALGTIAELNLTDSDVWIHVAPLFHLADAWATWAVTWVGGTHVLVNEFEPKVVLETIEKEGVTLTNLIPTMLNLLVNYAEVHRYDCSSLRVLLSGGAPIAPEVVRKVIETFKCDYIQTYGMTETSPYLTMSILKDHLHQLPAEEQLKFKATTGREFINVELKVVDEKGKAVKPDNREVGEIVVKGDTVTKGYWRLPEETEKTIRDGWLYTGDLAVIDEEGYVTIVDRKKDMIITGGENVYSTEVENVLYAHPAILEAAVIGVPDDLWGEAVKAVVVLKEGAEVTSEEIISFCKDRLTSFKAPRSVDFVQSLPRTGSGKIFKKGLRDEYWEGYEKRVH
ncbi:MAG: long-chain-fatty-acid--CoA ligase [Anaerolineae bacterium]